MDFFDTLVYFCGFIGCAAISFIPLRSFEMITFIIKGGIVKNPQRILLTVISLASLAVFLYEVRTLLRIYDCMTAAFCTNYGIGMWKYLAMLGMAYLAFEFLFFIVRNINTSLTKNNTGARQPKPGRQ